MNGSNEHAANDEKMGMQMKTQLKNQFKLPQKMKTLIQNPP